MAAPTVFLGLRMITTTFVYDDTDPARPPARRPGTPARVVSTIQSPAWTPEDRGLLAGLELAEGELCGGCGEPRSVAWHSDMDGDYEADAVVCFACSAIQDKKIRHYLPRVTRDFEQRPLPPFRMGRTTTAD